ncbi:MULTISPECIES: tetratricopeptide repeat protein [unclassified Nodularia (in: cyanobacteria)]|uniref:tetratricopeptide repeat protein n=1 Tax=unclassified Nodularia (in: cyanobacteria) TaxID=2656917 RepID=UPI00187FB6E7|nr:MULTISPECIES: tetratricopeptide repeat protein [unclassified Nodularia (in: cyanobacteria)]MBE9198517.1 tetratricopeptide repeat protein [Nodularia sp. LEGE 06071]MCC2691018.1 tetratricopeptide repeat protein [Nodularia sp. LEGE 04288]
MDWITLLRSLQSDFIQRLTSGFLLHCEREGQYSELTVISGERLKTLREFCWLMAEKYKRTSPVRDVFINNLKGKLGEEVVKERLADFITEVDYETRFGGDGNIDFTLNSNSTIGVEVKSRHGSIDKVRWSVSSQEVAKNAVVVCVLIQEEVNEAQPEYHLFLAGFLPTQMIKLRTGKISFGINQLLYGGGLWCYLEQLQKNNNYQDFSSNSSPSHQVNPEFSRSAEKAMGNLIPQPPSLQKPISLQEEGLERGFPDNVKNQQVNYVQNSQQDLNIFNLKLGDECFAKGKYEAAINHYNQALQLKADADIFYKRGLSYYQLGDYEAASDNFSQAIQLNFNDGKAYNKRGLARYQLGNYQEAIEDYTQAIRINPHIAVAYKNRAEARSHIGDNQGAIEDYTQAIKINPDYADAYKNQGIARYFIEYHQGFSQAIKVNPQDALAYKNRGNARADLEDYQGAIADYTQAIKINPNYVDAYYNRGNARYDLGDYEEAIEDYTQTIQINSNYAHAYYNRGNVYSELGDKQLAINDFRKAADIYRREGKLEALKDARERVSDLEIAESLDILNF